MPAPRSRPGHGRVIFDARFWAADLATSTPRARAAALAWRAAVEDDGGVPLSQLRPCDPDARDGSRLHGCAKAYIPAPAGDWGAVLRLVRTDDASPIALYVIAFGLRHPPTGRRISVYQVAHRRLHPPAH